MKRIQKLSRQHALVICSQQVILNLAQCVKELLENSIDAGARQVEVKLKNYGLDGVEVSDNGHGISESELEAITMRHATSKLSTMEDLDSVKTYGFRGEALSSLCALAKVTMITATSDAHSGFKATFNEYGHVVEKIIHPRAVGTTVVISDLFHSMPVRSKDFRLNAKREYQKCVQLIQDYALILTGVRMNLVHVLANGNRQTILTSSGSPSMSENIKTILGNKLFQTLVVVDMELSIDFETNKFSNIHIKGFISSPQEGYGRSSADKQYLYLHRRPCQLPKMARKINEVYRKLSMQYPAFVLDIDMPSGSYDVNITPDKRTIMLHKETDILRELESELEEFLRGQKSKYDMASANVESSKSLLSQTKLSTFMNSCQKIISSEHGSKIEKMSIDEEADQENHMGNQSVIQQNVIHLKGDSHRLEKDDSDEMVDRSVADDRDNTHGDHCCRSPVNLPEIVNINVDKLISCTGESDKEYLNETENDQIGTIQYFKNASNTGPTTSEVISTSDLGSIPITIELYNEQLQEVSSAKRQRSPVNDLPSVKKKATLAEQNFYRMYSFDNITAELEKINCHYDNKSKDRLSQVTEHAPAVDDPEAEVKLQRIIQKDDFPKMKIIGQFNKGFIIATLPAASGIIGERDLFVIDQHASDEIYLFHKFSDRARIEMQPLVCPKIVELSMDQLLLCVENKDFFNKNGFDFDVISNDAGKRIFRLKSLPVLYGKVLTSMDFEELLANLDTDPTRSSRCSKVRTIFASKACRAAFMVGDDLDAPQMRKIVNNLATIDRPWNCPHGRPTMRWLYRYNITL